MTATITLTEKTFTKNPNTKTTYILESDITETITETQYNNFISSIGWFRKTGGTETTQKNYTSVGYVVTKLTSVSPDRQTKIVRQFSFK